MTLKARECKKSSDKDDNMPVCFPCLMRDTYDDEILMVYRESYNRDSFYVIPLIRGKKENSLPVSDYIRMVSRQHITRFVVWNGEISISNDLL